MYGGHSEKAIPGSPVKPRLFFAFPEEIVTFFFCSIADTTIQLKKKKKHQNESDAADKMS